MRIFLALLVSILFIVACSEETVDINGEAVNYEDLQVKISEAEEIFNSVSKELNEANTELTKVKEALEGISEKYEGLEELAANRDKITKEVDKAESALELLQTEVSEFEEGIVAMTGESKAETEALEMRVNNSEKSSDATISQTNAFATAKSYLDYTSFSKSGLIEQLMFEGFSEDDAMYGVNQISLDWREQAVKSAQNYLDYSSFSRSGLIEQLTFEGFSNEDATYAVDQVGF